MNKTIKITVEMECIWDPTRHEGNSITFMSSEAGTITQDEVQIGKWYAPMLGGIEIKDNKSNETWALHPLDVIRAFYEEREKEIETIPGN